jgi:hypothetical protein
MAGYNLTQQQNTGSYVQQQSVFDVGLLYSTEVTSPEFKELLVRLAQQVNNHAISLNEKESGYYLQEIFANGKLFFNPNSSSQLDLRPGFTKVIDTGALAAGVNTIPHGLTIGVNVPVGNIWSFYKINGAANDFASSNYYPLPFAGAAGNNIEVRVNAANIVITNNSGQTFSSSTIVLEFLMY